MHPSIPSLRTGSARLLSTEYSEEEIVSEIRKTALTVVAAMVLIALGCAPKSKAVAPYDLQFIDTMTAHHEGAVSIAKVAEAKALHPELRQFARQVVEDQTREIASMGEWRGQWYAGQPKAVNMQLAGMAESMKGMDAGHIEMLSGAEFDLMFIEKMIPHHQGAVTMALDAAKNAQHEEIRQLAHLIVETQQREIEMMQRWAEEWKTAK